MTISAYISNLLKEQKSIEVLTSHVADGSDQYGLFRSPARSTRENLDGSYEITETYQFFAKQSTIVESERKEADAFLEDIAYWVDDLVLYDLPTIDGKRTVTSISCSGNPYPMEDDGEEALYQMTLSITYIRERI